METGVGIAKWTVSVPLTQIYRRIGCLFRLFVNFQYTLRLSNWLLIIQSLRFILFLEPQVRHVFYSLGALYNAFVAWLFLTGWGRLDCFTFLILFQLALVTILWLFALCDFLNFVILWRWGLHNKSSLSPPFLSSLLYDPSKSFIFPFEKAGFDSIIGL